jgi:TolB protein
MVSSMKLNIDLSGSLQNPTISPDGQWLLVTVWHGGYNDGEADLYAVNLSDLTKIVHVTRELSGCVNVSQPGLGSCWHKNGRVIFSSTKPGNDWPCTIKPDGTDFTVLPGYHASLAGYEPTFAPNGVDFAFQRHKAGQEKDGTIVAMVGSTPVTLAEPDSRQPAWAPNNNCVVYQRRDGKKWNLWLVDFDSKTRRVGSRLQLTDGDEFTDATWHPNGDRVLCSSDGGLYEVSPRADPRLIAETKRPIKYLGAPSWSPDGNRIVAEADKHDDPEKGSGTWIELFTL